jgi:lipid-A-disaccharide synthase
MRRVIQKLLIINPFEKAYFKEQGMEATYVGHPLAEEVPTRIASCRTVLKRYGIPFSAFPLLSAMPGSRPSEVKRLWTLYLETARQLRETYPDLALVVPRPAGFKTSDYPGVEPSDSIFFVPGPAYDLRAVCDAAWVKSGTGTLETALLQTPMVVVYKTSAFNAFWARRLVKLPYFSLVNLMAGKAVVVELMQEQAEPQRLAEETRKILEDESVRRIQQQSFAALRRDISRPSRASRNVAGEIWKMLKACS